MMLLLPLIAICSTALSAAGPDQYVLVVGNNHSIDPSAKDLRYADDDAVMYYQLFEPRARRVELLTTLDDETQAKHPTLAARSRPPTRQELTNAIGRLYEAIRASTSETELYFVFVGHGGLDPRGRGYVHLQDGRFSRRDLFAEVVKESPADFTHIIIDACNAFSLVGGRGSHAGSKGVNLEALLDSFLRGHDLGAYPRVGVLAASSRDRETHEWSQISSGIFSHQVRSALSGAADINGDGRVEYSEVSAFVDAANAGLPQVGKRVSVFAWPPQRDRHHALLGLRSGDHLRQVVLDSAVAGHLYVEDDQGERWVELNQPGPVTLTLPAARGFFVRNQARETYVPPGTDRVVVRDLSDEALMVAHRGAVDHAFSSALFSVPFTADYYRGFVSGFPQLLAVDLRPVVPPETQPPPSSAWTLAVGGLAGNSPLATDHMEVGGYLTAARMVAQNTEVGLTLEAAHTRVSNQAQTERLGALVGVTVSLRLTASLSVQSGVDLGYQMFSIRARPSSRDYSVAAGRGRFGARWLVSAVWSVEAQVTGTTYLATASEKERFFHGLGGTLGVAWH